VKRVEVKATIIPNITSQNGSNSGELR